MHETDTEWLKRGRPCIDGEEDRALRIVSEGLFGDAEGGRGCFGRYRILERLGSGSEGVIYRAHDPELDREVAIKFPRFEHGAAGERQRARLQREAEALARLAHPNVVPVYDVLVQEDDVCLVCEYVRGQSLDRWLRQIPRTPRQIFAVFREAGRGLAAVHAAGLIHRDFKPANVLVGHDGRVRVLDFGLARTELIADEAQETVTDTTMGTTQSAALPSLTRTGALLGTPLYMSPEQHFGAAVDARSDQWAFCMAIAEALLGRYPLPKSDLHALAMAKRANLRLSGLPAGVPRGWRRPLERGLRRDPERRFDSMDELLAALDRPSRPWQRHALAGVAMVGLASAAVHAVAPESLQWGATHCDEDKGLDGVWNGDRHDEIRSALFALDEPHVTETFERTRTQLDAFAARWWTQWNEGCAAADEREIDVPTLHAEQACLRSHASELDALLSSMESPSAESSRRLVQAVSQLGDPATCGEPGQRARWRDRPQDEVLARHVDEVRVTLAEALAMQRLGETEQALDILTELRDRAPDHRPLRVELLYHWGSVATELGRYRDAVEPLRQAFFEAEALGEGYEWIALNAAMSLATIHGVHRAGDVAETETWMGYAEAMAARQSDQDPSIAVNVQLLRANMLISSQRFEQAIPLMREVVEAYQGQSGDYADYKVYGPRQNLAVALLQAGHTEQAIAELQTAIREMQASLGPVHPAIAPVLANLGTACETAHDFDCAAESFERLEPLVRQYHHGNDALTAAFSYGMGGVHARADRYRLARRYRVDALEAAREVYGDDHVQTAIALYGLAGVELALGDLDTAHERLVQARELFARELGDDNQYAAAIAARQALVSYAQGHRDEAEQQAHEAWDLAARSTFDTAGTRAIAARLTGRIALERRRWDVARERLELAAELFNGVEGPDAFETLRVRAELGSAAAAAGDTPLALALLRDTRTAVRRSEVTARQRAELHLQAADIAWRLGRPAEAKVLADEATRDALRSPSSTEFLRRRISQWRKRTGT